MTQLSAGRGLLLLVALAALGLLLVMLPPRMVEHFRTLEQLSPWAARLYLGAVAGGGLLLVLTTLWILGRLYLAGRRRQQRRERHERLPSALSPAERRRQLDENLATVRELSGDEAVEPELRGELNPLAERLELKRQEQTLEIVAFGTISSGKSSLLNALAGRPVFATDPKGGTTLRRNQIPWPGADRVVLVDTPGLGEVDGAQRGAEAAEAARDADLVLVVVDGPLRDWELSLIERLAAMDKRILISLNKEDWYSREQREALLAQIREQAKRLVRAEDVVTVRAQPLHRRRVRVLPDGSEVEESVSAEPDISELADRMMRLVQRDGRDLLLGNLLLQSRGLVEQARQRVRQSLDRRAWQIVDKHMWAAGGAAALSPLPMLDLVAGSAVTTKMVLDLAKVYRQEMDLNTAVQLLAQLGKNLVAILGVSAATPVVVAAVASLLKMVPGAGTLAGGVLQGTVQALVTRWIGGVFIHYYQAEMQTPEGGLAALARRQWQETTRPQELRRLLLEARSKLPEALRDDNPQ